MSEQPELSVILPAYMEEENLRLLLPRMQETLRVLALPYEVLVVDVVTPLDATADACEKNSVLYFNRAPSNSFGDAVRTGIQKAKGKWILFMDADGSHNPEFIPHLLHYRDQYDLVIASRYVEGGFTENSQSLVVMSKLLNWTYAVILNLKMKDVSNSFKLYRAEQIKGISLKCENFDIVEELLYKLVRKVPNLRFKEVPFSFKKRMFGETKRNLFSFILTYLFTMIRLRFFL